MPNSDSSRPLAQPTEEDSAPPANNTIGPVHPQRKYDLWSVVGKVAAFLAVVGGIIKLYEFCTKPSVRLEATASCYELQLPAGTPDRWRDFQVRLGLAELMQAIGDALPLPEKKVLAERLHTHITRAFPTDLARVITATSRVCSIKIENNGTRQVEELVLKTPFRGLVQITGLGISPMVEGFAESVNIGTIRPSDTLNCILWFETIIPMRHIESDFNLTHKDGALRVEFSRDVYGIAAWLVDNLTTLVWLLSAIGVATLGMWLKMRQKRHNANK